MSAIDSVIKYAIGLLGIPALTTAVGVATSTATGFNATMTKVERLSAGLQMLHESDALATRLTSVLRFNRPGKYGSDRAYFTLSAYDGALKMLDSANSGDLYMVRLDEREYFVFAKYGLSASNPAEIVSQLNKRDGLNANQVAQFLKPLAAAVMAQQTRIEAMKRSGARP